LKVFIVAKPFYRHFPRTANIIAVAVAVLFIINNITIIITGISMTKEGIGIQLFSNTRLFTLYTVPCETAHSNEKHQLVCG
jgi:Zn-dependent membrane protease YugP